MIVFNGLTKLDLDDPPIRQLSYSLTKKLFEIPSITSNLEGKAQETFLGLLEKVRSAFAKATSTEGFLLTIP
jgi:hypothetical protein